VQIGDVRGVVSSVRLQVTHIRTIKNEEIVVPNSQILGASVTNYSSLAQSKGLILHTTVGIGYENAMAAGGGDADRSGAPDAGPAGRSRRRSCFSCSWGTSASPTS